MKAKDYRRKAWERLHGKWDTFALCMLIYAVIQGVCGALSDYYNYIGVAASLLIAGPFAAGLAFLSLNVIREQPIKVEMLFEGFERFLKTFLLGLINGVLILLWSLLLIVPGIVKSLSYGMSYYILLDNGELSANDARKRSMALMQGNKWRLFCLELSFIGWYLLGILTLGILFLWVAPYRRTAVAEFYRSLLPDRELLPETSAE